MLYDSTQSYTPRCTLVARFDMLSRRTVRGLLSPLAQPASDPEHAIPTTSDAFFIVTSAEIPVAEKR